MRDDSRAYFYPVSIPLRIHGEALTLEPRDVFLARLRARLEQRAEFRSICPGADSCDAWFRLDPAGGEAARAELWTWTATQAGEVVIEFAIDFGHALARDVRGSGIAATAWLMVTDCCWDLRRAASPRCD